MTDRHQAFRRSFEVRRDRARQATLPCAAAPAPRSPKRSAAGRAGLLELGPVGGVRG